MNKIKGSSKMNQSQELINLVEGTRLLRTNVYENKFGRFRVINMGETSRQTAWQVDWCTGTNIITYPSCQGDVFDSKNQAIAWVKGLAPTTVMRDKDLPTDGTWTDKTKTYEPHPEWDDTF